MNLTPMDIISEMFNGGFNAMDEHELANYPMAEPGSLISNIRKGTVYTCIFYPSTGEVFVIGKTGKWFMYPLTGEVVADSA